MVKILRSLIHEKLPLELRVKIELLSRRRDIINEEKHQELIQLLQSFGVEGVVPLGPGTNRYAFKLDGFVIKVATDHDGKIDNLKEFKMAKRLYPRVTKIYEVSDNGTLLVAEYIQPFASFQEMCKYAERIREILTELSSVYLIGDVGITSKNYANWGLRVGSDEPVCLDFAYVYEVSSDLFICRHCKTNSMLVPNKDFTYLCCSNNACGRKYLFEDIRSRIGNDIHRHEIGDLTEEGYALTESNVEVELDEKRSNYLARKKEKPKGSEKNNRDSYSHEQSVEEQLTSNNIKEEDEMNNGNGKKEFSGFRFSNGVVIPAVATVMSPNEDLEMLPAEVVDEGEAVEYVTADTIPDETADDGEVAFSEFIGDEDTDTTEADETDDGFSHDDLRFDIPPMQLFKHLKEVEEPAEVVAEAVVEEPVAPVKESVQEEPTMAIEIRDQVHKEVKNRTNDRTPAARKNVSFTDNFIRNAEWAVSKMANRIGDHMHALLAFDTVRGNIRDKKMYPETFYKVIRSAVYRSIISFCNFTEIPPAQSTKTDKEGNPIREFKIPSEIHGMPYEPTLIFISRFWVNKDINSTEEPGEIMMKYREKFNDYRGLQREWLDVLKSRLLEKMSIDQSGADKLVRIIGEEWCVIEEDDVVEEVETVNDDSEEEVIETHEEPEEEESLDISGTYALDENVVSPNIDVAQNPTEEDEDTDEDDDYYADSEYLTVQISPNDNFDIIRIMSGDAYGSISIPFYTKLSDVDSSTSVPSMVDDRNGVWDWLIHLVPDMIFRTKTPEKYLEVNDYDNDGEQLHMVILDENNGEYVMGIYYMTGIYVLDDDNNSYPTNDPTILAKLNKIVTDNIGYGAISHLRRSLSMTELIRTEEYISGLITYEDDDTEEGEEERVMDENTVMTAAEEAAVRSIMGRNVEPAQQDNTQYEEPEDIEQDPVEEKEESVVNDSHEANVEIEFVNSNQESTNHQSSGILMPMHRRK